MSDLVTVHHEMGHIQYYMNYVVQPPIYRRGANPGFHEAIGDLIALAVATPQHLVKVELLEPIPPADVEKINLNYQMKMALDKVAFLPFAYVMDKWRWDVFGEVATTETAMNRRWWEYRLQYQGLSPPITDRKRNERDFDPGAKYHIPAGVEYVRYFASHVLQFQFYERMCKTVTGITEQNLYTCDFDGNKEAGAALMAMLAQGSSRSWPDILESFIGSRTMSLGSLNKYFKPLSDYLDKFIADKGIKVGWSAKVEDYVEPMNAADFLAAANEQYRRALNAMTDAEWQQGSDISETNEANLVEAVEDFNAFRQKQFTQTKAFNFSALAPLQRRQFEKFAVIGTSALDEADASTFTNAKLAMETVFSTATIDAGGNSSLTLEPDLTEILATSTDEPLLKEVWTKFRDATGRKMRQNYTTYFTLGNKAATLNTLPGKGTFFWFDRIFKSIIFNNFYLFLLIRIQNLRRPVDVRLGGGRPEGAGGHADERDATPLPEDPRLRPPPPEGAVRRQGDARRRHHSRPPAGQHVGAVVEQPAEHRSRPEPPFRRAAHRRRRRQEAGHVDY